MFREEAGSRIQVGTSIKKKIFNIGSSTPTVTSLSCDCLEKPDGYRLVRTVTFSDGNFKKVELGKYGLNDIYKCWNDMGTFPECKN